MKILRIVNRGSYGLYAIIDGEVYRIPRGDPMEILEETLRGGSSAGLVRGLS